MPWWFSGRKHTAKRNGLIMNNNLQISKRQRAQELRRILIHCKIANNSNSIDEVDDEGEDVEDDSVEARTVEY